MNTNSEARRTQINPADMPALDGRPVTQGHADICESRGHASHSIDGGLTPHCPRCGADVSTELNGATSELHAGLLKKAETMAIVTGSRAATQIEADGVATWNRNFGRTAEELLASPENGPVLKAWEDDLTRDDLARVGIVCRGLGR